MTHHFNTEIAKIYGIEEAIIIDNLFFWIIKNEANGKNFFEGRYWTFNSVKSYNKLFTYMTESKIYRILNKLVSEDIIIKDNFNDNAFDRKGWYAFSDNGKTILENHDYHFSKIENGDKQNENTIADSKQQIVNEYTTKDDKDKSLSKKELEVDLNSAFEDCWKAYHRKGNKAASLKIWNKLTEEERQKAKTHIPYYTSSVDSLNFIKDFERYLKNKTFNTVVYKNKSMLFDPERTIDSGQYHPIEDKHGLMWSNEINAFVSLNNPQGTMFYDGYTDEERPNIAKVLYQSNYYYWNNEGKKWEAR